MNEPQGDVVSTKEDIVASQTVESKRTYCRVCMVMCGLVADVAGDQILKARADREHPLTQGYSCPKGRATGDGVTRLGGNMAWK